MCDQQSIRRSHGRAPGLCRLEHPSLCLTGNAPSNGGPGARPERVRPADGLRASLLHTHAAQRMLEPVPDNAQGEAPCGLD